MKSEDNHFNYFKSSKFIFNDDLLSQKNLSLNQNIEGNNIQQEPNYLSLNSPEKEDEECSIIKDELENENEINIDNFLTKDIINSINEVNSDPYKNSSKNESVGEISMQDEKESYEDEKESSKQNSEDGGDNNQGDDLKMEKESQNIFPFNFGVNRTSDFFIKNNLTFNTNKKEQIIHDNRYLNNNSNINNKNGKINCWNFNTNPKEIFNIDNPKNQPNNNEMYKFDNNIDLKIDVNNIGNSPIIKNKEITNLNEIFHKNEDFKLDIENIKYKSKEFLKNGEFLDDNYSNQKINLFQKQNRYINFSNKTNNEQAKNNSLENKFVSKDKKIANNFLERKDLYNNKLDINSINLNGELNELNKDQSNILNNNFNLYMDNKIIYYNNYINFIDPINQNKKINSIKNVEKIDSHDAANNNNDVSLGKEKNDLNPDNYLITMFDKLGWICRLCNNFNFESRNICNRCKTLKMPKTKKEINEEKEIEKIMKKRIKEKKIDWFCPNCKNINYGFRKNCNRCKIERKKEFPLIISRLNQKMKGNNINIISSKNINVNKNINNYQNYNY